jgi:hypothetical protein
LRVDAVSSPTTTFAFGTRVWLLEVAVIESKAVVLSPILKVKLNAVSSSVVLSVMSSTEGSASKAPISTVCVASASDAASSTRLKPVPR